MTVARKTDIAFLMVVDTLALDDISRSGMQGTTSGESGLCYLVAHPLFVFQPLDLGSSCIQPLGDLCLIAGCLVVVYNRCA